MVVTDQFHILGAACHGKTSSTQLTGGWVGPWESGLAVRNWTRNPQLSSPQSNSYNE